MDNDAKLAKYLLLNKDQKKQFVDDLLKDLSAREFCNLYHRFIKLHDEVTSCFQLLTRVEIEEQWAEMDRSFTNEEWKQIKELLEDRMNFGNYVSDCGEVVRDTISEVIPEEDLM